MSPGATFERVYLALREALGSGRYRPGEHLEPSLLSDELAASITPVRDALHRLVGEQLVEAPRGDGFRVPMITEVALRDLYAWQASLLALALRGQVLRPEIAPIPSEDDEPPATAAASLFRAIAATSGSTEHLVAIARLVDRLAHVRVSEQRLIADMDAEILQLRKAVEACDQSALRRVLTAYHRRRLRIVPGLVADLLGA